MVTNWSLKELLASVKMNQLGVSKYSSTEQIAIIDSQRLVGMVTYNTDNKAMQIYQSGVGATFNITELTNFLFKNNVNLGITIPKQTVYNESFVNTKGKMNISVFVSLQFLQEVSIAGEIQIVVTDGITPVTVTDSLSSTATPTKIYRTYAVATTSFAIDTVLQIQVKLTQVQIEFVEMRGI